MTHRETEPDFSEISRRAFLLGASGAAALYLAGCSHPETEPAKEPTPEFAPEPDWQQDFSKMPDGPIDTSAWNIAIGNANGWGNNQQQYYTANSQNVRLQGGRLVLQANYLSGDKRKYISGRIDTHGKQSFDYGRLEITGRVPAGTGTWSAFWMLPENPAHQPSDFGLSPDAPSLNGEIDIMEALGSRPGMIYPNLHTYETATGNAKLRSQPSAVAADDNHKFHTYGVERTPDNITFTYDHKPYYQARKQDLVSAGHETDTPLYWPFDQKYYLILNLAMGGDWGGEKSDQYPPYGIDNSTGPWQLQVSSVKHFPLLPPSS